MNRVRTILLLALISLIVPLSFQLTEKISDKPSAELIKKRKAKIDYSINNFTLISMNKQGNTQYHLSAESMVHFMESDETHVVEPRVTLNNQVEGNWIIQAKDGTVSSNGKNVLLQGKVKIQHGATKKQTPVTITTETLHINTENNTVSTKDNIKLEGNGLTLKAKGMLTELGQETIQLLAKVRGTYAPSQ